MHAFSGDTSLTRASASFIDRAATLAHFGSWSALLRSDVSVERIPGAGAGDTAQLAVVHAELP